ncbi:hypothetical protein [Streptomyces sasae]|uniref:hypothetical protein n=1 Tax=Streptomyces sasae TaxID=1266772 RepID=UPI00292CDDF8|nr:hypothetical protein [Streptomyces sasae]
MRPTRVSLSNSLRATPTDWTSRPVELPLAPALSCRNYLSVAVAPQAVLRRAPV